MKPALGMANFLSGLWSTKYGKVGLTLLSLPWAILLAYVRTPSSVPLVVLYLGMLFFTIVGLVFLYQDWRVARARSAAEVAQYEADRERALSEAERIRRRRPPLA